VQAKLVLGPANDRYEQEADRVAQRAMGRQAARHGPAVQQADEHKEARLPGQPGIQRLRGAAGSAVDTRVARASSGRAAVAKLFPLPLRGSIEQALGADFAAVRVQTDARSDRFISIAAGRGVHRDA
jgi:hypothetical protein